MMFGSKVRELETMVEFRDNWIEKLEADLEVETEPPKLFDYTVHYEYGDRGIVYRADTLDWEFTPLAMFVRGGVCVGVVTKFLYIDSVPLKPEEGE